MTMKMKYALCGIVLAAFVTPALAANKFYVVRDTTTKECSIVEQKPTVATMKLVGTAHKTQAKAEKAMKVAKICDTK
jgi:accessory gene regulator protein AgrB